MRSIGEGNSSTGLHKHSTRSSAEYSAFRTEAGKFRITRASSDDVPLLLLGYVEEENHAKRMLEILLMHDTEIHASLLASNSILDYVIYALRASVEVPSP